MLQFGSLLANTPLGCRIIFFSASACYLILSVNVIPFLVVDLVCRPADVVYGLQLQRLLSASLVHTSLFGLLLALLVCWRRFAFLETQIGTLGFLLWFLQTSVILHGAYCVVMLMLAPMGGRGLLMSEVHGMFPLITANLVVNIKESDNSTVWLWPFPIYVSVRAFPVIVIVLSWLLHREAHLDVVLAYVLASTCPAWLFEPSTDLLDRVEQLVAGKWLLQKLQVFESFACRPMESLSNVGGGFQPLGGSSAGEPCGFQLLGDYEDGHLAPSPFTTGGGKGGPHLDGGENRSTSAGSNHDLPGSLLPSVGINVAARIIRYGSC